MFFPAKSFTIGITSKKIFERGTSKPIERPVKEHPIPFNRIGTRIKKSLLSFCVRRKERMARKTFITALLLLGLVSFVGCGQKTEQPAEVPAETTAPATETNAMEEAAENMENAAENMQEAAENAAENVSEAASEATEKAAEEVKKAADDMAEEHGDAHAE